MSLRTPILVLMVLAATACTTIPRDAGLSSVRETVLERGGVELDVGARVDEILAEELDPNDVVAVALANNPRVRLMLTDLAIARAELIEASTIPNPILELEWRSPGRPHHPYELTLAQSILDLALLPRRRAAGRVAFEADTRRVAAEILAFAADARDAYWRLLAATRRIAFSRTTTEAALVAAQLAIRQHEAGNITDLDLERRQAAYERAKLTLARDEEDALLAREALVRAMGLRDASRAWRIAAEFPPLPAEEPDLSEIEIALAERRLDLIVAARELEALRRLLPVSRLEDIGEVVLDVHREREAGGEKTTGPGIQFPIPIFNRGAAGRARAEALLARAEQTLAALTIDAASEARIARQRLLAARARVEYYRDVIVPRQIRIVELTKLEHNSMLLGTYDLLAAREEETAIRREYADAQLEYWTARNDLDRALNGVGGGSAFEFESMETPTARPREGAH